MSYHEPVLLDESVLALDLERGGVFVDATFGGGGHSRKIVDQLANGRLFAFDQDQDAIDNAFTHEKLTLIRSNFKYIKNHLRYFDAMPINGLLLDLGVSSHQFDEAERGFSFRFEALLDMRMNRAQQLNAKDLLNQYTEDNLLRIFKEYGELQNSKAIVNVIVSARLNQPIDSINDLKKILSPLAPPWDESGFWSKVFQAIRIEVNQELAVLQDLLLDCESMMEAGARLVVLTYHSLEDRMVKKFMTKGSLSSPIEDDPAAMLFGTVEPSSFKLLHKKPIVPSADEQQKNPRSRSAHLRIATKI
jgi:16S rRNA (cytosine1402-N4)-methyltransferase